MIRMLIGAALAAALVPAVAIAEEPIVVAPEVEPFASFRTIVSFADLNLATAEGSETLKTRVKRAARNGCYSIYHGEFTVRTVKGRTICIRSSTADGMAQVDRVIQLAQSGSPVGTEIAIALHP